ncbi:VgrG-related protein [Thalassiella azotivora]
MPEGRRLDGAQVTVDGRDLGADLYARLRLVRVEESVQLPDRFTLHLDDPHFELFDADAVPMGARVEVAYRAEGQAVVVTSGEVTAVSVEPGVSGRHELVVSGMDLTHRLMRGPRTRTFTSSSDADVAGRIARDNGLDADVERGGTVHEHLVQAGETDLAFLRRRAVRSGFDVWVTDRTLHVRARPDAPGSPPVLRWGENLQRFKVRFSSTEHCDRVVVRSWDPLGKRAVTGRSRPPQPWTDAPAAQQMVGAADRAFGRTERFAPQVPVPDGAAADGLAQSFLERASGAETVLRGETAGDPRLAAGSEVQVEGVGSRLSGRYRVTAVEHVLAAGVPYVTRFVCGGKEPAGLADLTRGAGEATVRRGFGGLVVGVVTNNDDPERLGRVKVQLPALSDQDESGWARLLVPGGGKGRGLQALPEVGDEVLVGFELGDLERPVVCGGLWNREDAPPVPGAVSGGAVQSRVLASRKDHRLTLTDDPTESVDLSLGDGSCSLHLEAKASGLTGDTKLVVTAQQIEIKADSKLVLEAPTVEVKASGPLTATGKPIKLN